MPRKRRTSKEVSFETSFYEGVLRRAPDFIEALIAIGDLYTKQGLFAEGLAVDERLSQLRPTDPIIRYNLACSYSLVGDVANALVAIKKALACGYEDIRYLLGDEDLANLHADAGFATYIRQIADGKNACDMQPLT